MFIDSGFYRVYWNSCYIGAFIFGIVLGNCESITEKTKETIENFSKELFVPLFFVSIGLRIDFIHNFNFLTLIIIMFLAFSSKIVGTFIGAKLSGLKTNESIAISFAMNARGAMEIVLANLALNIKLIDEKMFVALVITALITSLTSAPLIKACKIQ